MSDEPDPPDERETARRLFETGASLRDVGRAVGKSRETIRRWATAGEWHAPLVAKGLDHQPKVVPTTEELEAARLRAEKAQQEARTRWSVRRGEEADAAGITAALVRSKIVDLLNHEKGPKAAEARALAVVYGIFVDKAIVMSGDGRLPGRQGDEARPDDGPRPTDPKAMAEAGAARALRLVRPTVAVTSREA